MQNSLFLILFSALFVFQFAFASENSDFKYSGYLRGGSGNNLKGGVQECFNNSGAAPSNEFRLGNECGYYGEVAFTKYHSVNQKTDQEKSNPYFLTQIRFSFSPQGYRLFEASNVNNRGVNLTEGFVEAGNIGDQPYVYWLGKRFYRQIDAHIDDWYYFADTSGVGAGVDRIPTAKGSLAVAHLMQTSDTSTSSGHPQLQFIDVRLNDIPMEENQKAYLWTGYGWSPRGSGGGNDYVATRGWLLGLRHNWQISGGFNDFAVIYGKGIM